METFSALLALCAGNSPVPGEFTAQRPVTRSFDVFFDLRPNKRLSKHSQGWWFETLSSPLWRHRNGIFPNVYPTFGCLFWYCALKFYVNIMGAIFKQHTSHMINVMFRSVHRTWADVWPWVLIPIIDDKRFMAGARYYDCFGNCWMAISSRDLLLSNHSLFLILRILIHLIFGNFLWFMNTYIVEPLCNTVHYRRY